MHASFSRVKGATEHTFISGGRFYMAEITTIENPELPPKQVVVKSVTPTMFWIVAGVLAAGVIATYALLDNSIKQTRADVQATLDSAMTTQKTATDKALADTRSSVNTELAKMQEMNRKLEAEKEELKTEVASLRKEHEALNK